MPHPLPKIATALPRVATGFDALSLPARIALCQFLFVQSEWQVQDLARDLRQNKSVQHTAVVVDAACMELVEQGLLAPILPIRQSPPNHKYALAAIPPLATARGLLAEAVAGGWSSRFENRSVRFAVAPVSTLAHKMLLSLLSGGANLPHFDPYEDYEDLWWASVCYAELLAGEAEMGDFAFPANTPSQLYRTLASVLFIRGLPVAPLLPDWAAHWRASKRWKNAEAANAEDDWNDDLDGPVSPYDFFGRLRPTHGGREYRLGQGRDEFAAFCMWTGRTDLLDALGTSPSPGTADWFFANACRAILAGNAVEGRRLLDAFRPRIRLPVRDGEVDTLEAPASHLFLLAHWAFRPRRPAVEFRRLANGFRVPAEGAMNHFAERFRDWFGQRERETASFLILANPESPPPSAFPTAVYWNSPAASLGFVLAAASGTLPSADGAKYAPEALRLARRADALGYPALAAACLSAFAWHFRGADADEANALAAHLSKTLPQPLWFRPWTGSEESWRRVVETFDNVLPPLSKTTRKPQTRNGRIVWHLHLRPDPRLGPGSYRCSVLVPAYRGPRAGDDPAADRPLSVRAALGTQYGPVLTDADRAALAEFPPSCRTPDGWLDYNGPSAKLLECLCNHPGLAVCLPDADGIDADPFDDGFDDDWPPSASFPKPPPPRPATLVRRDLPLSARSREDGGMTLSVPAWALRAADVAGGSGNSVTPVIRLGEGTPQPCELYVLPLATRSALKVFALCGHEGRIDLPRDAMDAFKPILPRLAAVAPLQGELEAVSGGADLPRIPADPTPLVRLRLDGPSLALTLHVRPLPDAPALLVPGAGQPERLIARNGKSAVLVRDLAAEKATAAPVRDALAPFESWQANSCEWLLDDPAAMLSALDALRALGEKVRLEWLSPKTLSVAAPNPKSWHVSAVAGAGFWFSVKAAVDLDDGRRASLTQLVDAWKNRVGDFVPFGENAYIRLSSALARRIEALSAAARPAPGKGKDALALPPAALPMLDAAFDPDSDRDAGLALPKPLAERAAAVREAFAATPAVPARLAATLRPYQLDAYLWLSRLSSAGFGACLADDMGLGKTLETIALLLARAPDGPSLVVCPASVCGNWRSELARFAPTLRPVMAWDAGPAATLDALASAGPGDIVVAGYALLAARADAFAARPWNGVVLDEAQAVKNPDTLRARAVKRLSARFRVACTGTPVENRLADVWSLFDFLNPGLLGSPADFARRFAADGRPAPALKRLLSPLILRRTKRDVLDDLPDKTEITLPVLLSDEERAGYETLRRNALDSLEASGGKSNRISILAELTRLRRYCCHPSLVLGPGSPVPSAKLEALLDLLANLRENRHRALVFSQFTDALAIVRSALSSAGFSHLYLDGQTPAAERARLVDAFQRGEGDFFLVSLKAGGLGLNLTAANYVILLDPWWNPAVEQQAADRAHRIGQKHPVTVYRLIAADTVEERVLSLHAEKNALSRDLLDSPASSPALSPDLLLSLFR